jgi:3-hydroxybutyryl-CoA dehydrogenase
MGAGIAQVALEAGSEVVLHDVDPEAIERARARIRDGLERRAKTLDVEPSAVVDWVDMRLDGLRQGLTLDAVASQADLVIEAALEDLDLKCEIFRALDAGAQRGAILATNTSALSVAAIAGATRNPGRVIGLHFFNPVPKMALVEVVPGPKTRPTIVARAEAAMRAWGKTPVRSSDTPGFIVNRVNRPFTITALRLLEDDRSTVETIDGAMRSAGFPMGPFELMDLAGLDINLAAATSIWEGLGQPERLRPSPIQERLVAEGRLGRKTGAGFYTYRNGRRGEALDATEPRPTTATMRAADIRTRILDAIDAEARRARDEGVAGEDDIDLAMRLGANHPSGPFERARATPE